MKTIATAAVLLALTAPVWAGEPEDKPSGNAASDTAASGTAPIVLSEAEMDGVTAGEAATAGGYRRFVIVENTSPLPADSGSAVPQNRQFFSYQYVQN